MIKKILEHKITLIISSVAFLVVVVGSSYFLFSSQKHVLTNATAQVMTIHQLVSADGKVDSDQHVALSFPKGGRVTSVTAKVGDQVSSGQVLVALDSSQLAASLEGAKADQISAKANLTALEKGATTQTLAVYNQNVSTAKLALTTAIKDIYLKVQDALLNKINNLFTNNTSANPTLVVPTQSVSTAHDINFARMNLTDRLESWSSLIQDNPIGNQSLSTTLDTITVTKKFLDSLSVAVNRLTAANSGLVQSDINSYVAMTNGAALEVNAAETEYNAALQAYKTVTDQTAVVQASSTPEALEIAQASVTKTGANIASIQSQINDTMLVAPFDGIVASIEPKLGENFPAGTVAVDIISPGSYKIDIMVPENQVAAVSVGGQANVIFSAYGSDLTATGTVASIDLSPTTVNGVGAYKTTIYLNNSDPRIRTGMNANVTIDGASVQNVVAVPASAIITKNDGLYSLVLSKTGSYVERKIIVGISDGQWTEIKSGIQAGETVATFGETI